MAEAGTGAVGCLGGAEPRARPWELKLSGSGLPQQFPMMTAAVLASFFFFFSWRWLSASWYCRLALEPGASRLWLGGTGPDANRRKQKGNDGHCRERVALLAR